MAAITLADMAQNFALRRHNASLQADVQRLSTEAVTGLASDTGRRVGGNYTELSAITGSLARLQAQGVAMTLAKTLVSGTQDALDTMGKAVGSLATEMSDPTLTGNPSSVAALGASSLQAFESVVGTLNARAGGQSLFAGTAVDDPALADAATILSAVQQAAAGATTAQDAVAAVDRWFAEDFATVAYQGGGDRAVFAVGDNDRVKAMTTATDPALVETLKGLALGALLTRGALAGSENERQALAQSAGTTLLGANDARTTLAARVGAGEARLEAVQTRATAQLSTLEMARTNLLSVDSYETAVRLEATQTQIETLYSVTARLSRMSLTDFL